MNKRKILGILKYGTRTYTSAPQKLQEGGFVAVSKAYDWRDDPYELMLLQQKAAQTNASIRAAGSGRKGGSGSGSGSGSKKIETFERLEGGLPVTNEYINAVSAKTQEAFYNKVRSNEEGWASSTEGQIEFQKISNEGNRLEEKAKKEEDNFNAAFDKIDVEDRKTLAISSSEGVMAWDATGKGQRLSMAAYLENADKYKIMDVNEFADWKKNRDTQLQDGLTNEFLKENAIGHNTLRKTYIDGKEDQIQYAFLQGRIVKKSSAGESEPKEVIDSSLFRQGLSNMMNGVDFYTGMSVVPESRTNVGYDVVNSIYNDIMNETASKSQLGASLAAEVLRDSKHVRSILAISGIAQKEAYLEAQKKALLASKIVDKAFGKSANKGTSGEESEGSNYDPASFPLHADLEAAYDGTELKQYTIGTNTGSAKRRRVDDLNMPMIQDGLSPADLNLVFDESKSIDDKKAANNFTLNKAVNAYSDRTEIYTPAGDNFRGLLGSNEYVKQFIGENAVIAPHETMPIVFMGMDNNGKIRSRELLELSPLKLKSRQQFLASTKGKLFDKFKKPVIITTKADELLPGNTVKKAVDDTKEYQLWVQKGLDFDKHKNAAAAAPGNISLQNAYLMAKDAKKMILETSAAFRSKFGNNPVTMQPMLGTWIIFDNDRFDMKESIDKKTNGGFGSNMVMNATSAEKEFLQNTNGIDTFNWGLYNDNVYKMMIFTKVKSLGKSAAEQGTKLSGVSKFRTLGDKMSVLQDSMSLSADPDNLISNALFLMQ